MRVIEPKQLQRRSIKKKKRGYKRYIALVILCALGFGVWKLIEPQKIADKKPDPQAQQTQLPAEQIRTRLKNYTNEEFVKLYSSFAYPNTAEITIPPAITGNSDADKRIQQLAEARGYKLRSAPIVAPIPAVAGFYIQQKAQQPLNELIAAAKSEGMTITLTAAFRSVDEQRELFLSRLEASAGAIAAGNADSSVNETLKTTAPPGYSRHHNGFTVDIACGNIGGLAFLETSCYEWLSKDNFKNAKEFGWIPSYPEGTNSVGPEPEPWEYVWVSKESLLE